jgi:SAM-dependent methyltransferase
MGQNFTSGSDDYARYRPSYPPAFFNYLRTIVSQPQRAWDCGTGTGQLAEGLAKIFGQVYATDISETQLAAAISLPNIEYSLQEAEHTSFHQNFFDLVIVGQAVHWFDFKKFYSEVRRIGKDGAPLVITGYGRFSISEKIDEVIDALYYEVLGSFWDRERRYIDEDYKTIPFPFDEMEPPAFELEYEWSLEHLVGYLNTWSAVKKFSRQKGTDPVGAIQEDLHQHWGPAKTRRCRFPLLLRVGMIQK